MGRLQDIRTQLDLGHPSTGAYDADDAVAAGEMMAENRPDRVSIETLIKFLLLDNTHQTDGDDTQARPLWIRMKEVAALTPPTSGTVPNPWGSTEVGALNEIKIVKTQAIVEFFTLTAQGSLAVDLTDSNFQSYVTGAENAGCMSPSQKSALLALSDNLQSLASEESLGRVRAGDVTAARAL